MGFRGFKKIKEMLEEEMLPEKSYSFEKSLTIEEINDLLSNEIIQDFETKNLLNGGTYTSYQCKDCKYRSVCNMNATNEGTTNNC
ncbi:radical SAM additional 4Fe4S-binding domain-containing protein [Fusobacterium necrophorum subsp. funduliforme 1_1_36S]|nr:radical SAM additional 4Fe4S-binding domain-containing protein [Fusobacterium necrophorum subsp. funduliforme 1_1_36S]